MADCLSMGIKIKIVQVSFLWWHIYTHFLAKTQPKDKWLSFTWLLFLILKTENISAFKLSLKDLSCKTHFLREAVFTFKNNLYRS